MYKFPVEYWVCICVSYFLLAAYSSNFRSSLGMNLKKIWKIFNSINSDQGRYLVGILKVHAYVNISSPRYYEPHLAECWFKYFLKPLISKQSNLNLAKRNTVNMKTFFFFLKLWRFAPSFTLFFILERFSKTARWINPVFFLKSKSRKEPGRVSVLKLSLNIHICKRCFRKLTAY